ncbi:MAG: sulfur carrier protein ThiS [Holophagales bacterium]|nr:sulfur carrier protein ThiS [Holophagales bacterium]
MPTSPTSAASVRIVANGTELEVASGTMLLEWLRARDRDPRTVAVERNGEIVPRARYGEIRLEEGDRLEVVGFVQGG